MTVTAEPADQARLLDLAALDLESLKIKKTLASLPQVAQIAEAEKRLLLEREAHRAALSVVEQLRTDLERAESDVSLVTTRMASDREKLSHSTSAKDAQGLDHELHSLEERLRVLEEVEIDIMQRLEDAERELADAEATATATDESLQNLHRELAAERSRLQEQADRLALERSTLAETFPSDLLALYERQRERYGHGASRLRAGVSEASGVRLTESDLEQIRRTPADQVVLCPDSNAILVRSEGV